MHAFLFFFFLMFKVFEVIACFIPVVFFCILCLFGEILFESCLFSWCFKVLAFPHSLFVPFEIRLGLSPGWVSLFVSSSELVPKVASLKDCVQTFIQLYFISESFFTLRMKLT